MLDDLKMIHERDSQDALGIAERQWQQLDHAFELPEKFTETFRPERISNVVYAGMGGTAASAMIAQTWLRIAKPFEIVRDYDLPAYVGNGTLCIVGSYSGNTEESTNAFAQAEAKGAQIVVIANGGELEQLATEKVLPFLKIPSVNQPRFAQWYTLKAIVAILDACHLTTDKTSEMVNQQAWFREQLGKWRPESPTVHNEAKRIALELAGKSVVVYAGPKLAPIAYKWKISINENAKHVAWWNQYPEFNHNEFLGWTKQPVQKPYAVIDIRSDLEDAKVSKRFEVSERLLSGVRPAPMIIKPAGDTLLQQMLYTAALGDFVSIYLALLGGIDPTLAPIVDKLKNELA